MVTPPDDADLRECTDTAFGLLELVKKTGGDLPVEMPDVYQKLLELIAKHGGGALAAVWMIWGRLIALGLAEQDKEVTALFPDLDGSPDLRYARNVVTIARVADPESMAELVHAVYHDQQLKRTGASIEWTSAFLVMGASRYGKPTQYDTTHQQ